VALDSTLCTEQGIALFFSMRYTFVFWA
jgi:hypothetical protein